MQASQKRAITSHRHRLSERGISRYEVRGLPQDKDLVRKLAMRLAENDTQAARLRAEIAKEISGEPPRVGGIVEALLNSPFAGADLQIEREFTTGRDINL